MNLISKIKIHNKLKKPNKKRLNYIYWAFGIIIFAAIFLFTRYVFSGLQPLEKIENPTAQLASNVWSKDHQLIGQFFKENRVEVSVDSIPSVVINALIATEDKNFYHHWGVDMQRFVKAIVKTVFLFKKEGASTITQQLAKNMYSLKAKRESTFGTIVRKIREWITAIQIEKTYTKREILEMYFNTSYFGNGAYGINMAARAYFDKNVKQLTVTEAGVLISLLKSNVYYDPFEKYDNAFRRRNLVMSMMVDAGYLSEDEYERLKLQPIKLNYRRIEEGYKGTIAPHFLEYIRQQMEKIAAKEGYDLYEDGLNIYTTLDSRMQKIAVHAAQVHIEDFQKQFDKFWNWSKNKPLLDDIIDKAAKSSISYKAAIGQEEKRNVYNRLVNSTHFIDSLKNNAKRIELGFIAIDPKNGEVRAMVGGRDPNMGRGLNHVTQIKRQPGSAFKPIVYSVAIDNGLYPAYPMLNQRFQYPDGSGKIWSPENFDHSTGGFTTLRHALAESLNIIAARLIIENKAPLWQIGRNAERMGIKTKLDLFPSIALGASVVSPIELTSAYATLANHGIYNDPISILKIEDKDGILIDNFTTYSSEALPEETVYIVTDMMRSAIDYGTGSGARRTYNFQRPAAGKTGTTQEFADAWFLGFTPQLCAGTWVGFDDHRVSFTGNYGQGAQAAMPIWAIFMHDVYEQMNFPLEDFSSPASGKVVTAKFCSESIESGEPKLYSSDCRTGVVSDIINVKDLPQPYNSSKDANTRFFDRFPMKDTVKHEAKEIR